MVKINGFWARFSIDWMISIPPFQDRTWMNGIRKAMEMDAAWYGYEMLWINIDTCSVDVHRVRFIHAHI